MEVSSQDCVGFLPRKCIENFSLSLKKGKYDQMAPVANGSAAGSGLWDCRSVNRDPVLPPGHTVCCVFLLFCFSPFPFGTWRFAVISGLFLEVLQTDPLAFVTSNTAFPPPGPFIWAEVGDILNIVFKNNATRPYSIHAHGIVEKSKTEPEVAMPGEPLSAIVPLSSICC